MASAAQSEQEEYVLQSRCRFELENLRALPINGVKMLRLSHKKVDGKTINYFDIDLVEYKLNVRFYLPSNYPSLPPMAQLFSRVDSVLPHHPDVDQSDGRIERMFAEGEWSKGITLRDILLRIIDMLEHCKAKKTPLPRPEMLNQPHRVRGTFKDQYQLNDWQYDYLFRSGLAFIDKLQLDLGCSIRFFKQPTKYLLIRADDYSMMCGVKTQIESHLEDVQDTRETQRARLERQMELADRSDQNGGVENESSEECRGRNNNNDHIGGGAMAGIGARALSFSGPVGETMQSSGMNMRGEMSSNVNAPQRPMQTDQRENAVSHTNRGITEQVHATPNPFVSSVASPTLANASSPSTGGAMAAGGSSGHEVVEVHVKRCRYCYRRFPEDAILRHLEFCKMAPKKFVYSLGPSVADAMQQQQREQQTASASAFAQVQPTAAPTTNHHHPSNLAASAMPSNQASADPSTGFGDLSAMMHHAFARLAASTTETERHQLKRAILAKNTQFLDSLADRMSTTMIDLEQRMEGLEVSWVDRMVGLMQSGAQRAAERRQSRERMDQLETRLLCTICTERDKDSLLDCGHMYCGPCSTNLQSASAAILCPICRVETRSVIKAYL